MDLERIKEVLDIDNAPDEVKEGVIISILAEDENLIPTLLKMLQSERLEKDEVILNASLALSISHMYVNDTKVIGKKRAVDRDCVLRYIKDFYKKYKGKVDHNFRTSEWGNKNLKDIYEITKEEK